MFRLFTQHELSKVPLIRLNVSISSLKGCDVIPTIILYYCIHYDTVWQLRVTFAVISVQNNKLWLYCTQCLPHIPGVSTSRVLHTATKTTRLYFFLLPLNTLNITHLAPRRHQRERFCPPEAQKGTDHLCVSVSLQLSVPLSKVQGGRIYKSLAKETKVSCFHFLSPIWVFVLKVQTHIQRLLQDKQLSVWQSVCETDVNTC